MYFYFGISSYISKLRVAHVTLADCR